MSAPSATGRLLVVAVVAVLALTLAPATTAAAPTPAESTYQTKVLRIVNNIRDNHDRVRLRKSKCLQRFANRQAERMAGQQRLFHQDPGPVMRRCGLSWYGENVVFTSGGPRAAVRLWMGSAPHRANILRRKYRITGVATRKAGGYRWTAQVFGRR